MAWPESFNQKSLRGAVQERGHFTGVKLIPRLRRMGLSQEHELWSQDGNVCGTQHGLWPWDAEAPITLGDPVTVVADTGNELNRDAREPVVEYWQADWNAVGVTGAERYQRIVVEHRDVNV